jgi:hypothetical protein
MVEKFTTLSSKRRECLNVPIQSHEYRKLVVERLATLFFELVVQ